MRRAPRGADSGPGRRRGGGVWFGLMSDPEPFDNQRDGLEQQGLNLELRGVPQDRLTETGNVLPRRLPCSGREPLRRG